MSDLPDLEPVAVKLVFKEKIPSNWDITPGDDDTITAMAATTGEHFEGTVSEFNAALKA